MKYGTAKIACSCKHEQQDEMHGKGVRIANTLAKSAADKSHEVQVRCTVCGAIHRVNESQVR